MAEYNYVPGFTVNLNDGGLSIPIEPVSSTEALLIIGPATKGPTDKPVRIVDQAGLTEFGDTLTPYGTAEARNLLTSAWKQAYDAGCRTIYLMRLENDGADAPAKLKKLFFSFYTALGLLSDFTAIQHICVVGLHAHDSVTYTAPEVAVGTGAYEGLEAAIAYDPIKTLADFVEDQIKHSNEIIGYIGAEPLGETDPTLAQVRAHIEALPDLADAYNGFINVVGGIDLLFNAGFSYVDNGVAAYAGLTTTLPARSATTNKTIFKASLIYTISTPMLDALGDKKYVTFKRRNNAVAVTMDITAAKDGSDFVLLSTARILLQIVRVTRKVCEPYIGEGASQQMSASMETAIHSAYKTMVSDGSIINYQFVISQTPQEFLAGRTTIKTQVIPSIERRRILLDIATVAQL